MYIFTLKNINLYMGLNLIFKLNNGIDAECV